MTTWEKIPSLTNEQKNPLAVQELGVFCTAMKVGDIVLYQESRWKVSSHSRSFRTCQLVAFDGRKVEVPDDLDLTPEPELKVLFNPPEQWPFTASPVHSFSSGPIVDIVRGPASLLPLVDWVPSDFLRPGGSIFFNPALKLRLGEILVSVHRDGTRNRITITRTFGTIRSRRHRVNNPPKVKGPKTNLDRLLESDILDED